MGQVDRRVGSPGNTVRDAEAGEAATGRGGDRAGCATLPRMPVASPWSVSVTTSNMWHVMMPAAGRAGALPSPFPQSPL